MGPVDQSINPADVKVAVLEMNSLIGSPCQVPPTGISGCALALLHDPGDLHGTSLLALAHQDLPPFHGPPLLIPHSIPSVLKCEQRNDLACHEMSFQVQSSLIVEHNACGDDEEEKSTDNVLELPPDAGLTLKGPEGREHAEEAATSVPPLPPGLQPTLHNTLQRLHRRHVERIRDLLC